MICYEECPANKNGICLYGDFLSGLCEAEKEFWNKGCSKLSVNQKRDIMEMKELKKKLIVSEDYIPQKHKTGYRYDKKGNIKGYEFWEQGHYVGCINFISVGTHVEIWTEGKYKFIPIDKFKKMARDIFKMSVNQTKKKG